MSLNKPIWKLKDWVDADKLDWYYLSSNPNAVDYLLANPDKMDWKQFSTNPNSINYLLCNEKDIDYDELVFNPNCYEIYRNDIEKLKFGSYLLSGEPNAIEFVKKDPSEINWDDLSRVVIWLLSIYKLFISIIQFK